MRSAAATSGRRSSSCDGKPTGMGGGAVVERPHGNGEARGLFADEHRNGVLILRSRNAGIGCGRLRAFQSGLRFDERNLIVHAIVIASLFAVDSLLVGVNGFVEQLLQRILAANLKVVFGQAGLFCEPFILKIGGA